MMMQRTANENAASERRICKRSDQPKIESNKLSTVAIVGFLFELYHVVAPLSF